MTRISRSNRFQAANLYMYACRQCIKGQQGINANTRDDQNIKSTVYVRIFKDLHRFLFIICNIR